MLIEVYKEEFMNLNSEISLSDKARLIDMYSMFNIRLFEFKLEANKQKIILEDWYFDHALEISVFILFFVS